MSSQIQGSAHAAVIAQIDKGPITQAMRMLPLQMDSKKARCQLLTMGLQESRLVARDQLEKGPVQVLGPALGLWQFEKGGVRGLMSHPLTKDHLRNVCRIRNVPYSLNEIWARLATDDVLAAALARLNLYWNSKPLPELNDFEGSWNYYLECWRPGKPHRETWDNLRREVLLYLAPPTIKS